MKASVQYLGVAVAVPITSLSLPPSPPLSLNHFYLCLHVVNSNTIRTYILIHHYCNYLSAQASVLIGGSFLLARPIISEAAHHHLPELPDNDNNNDAM